ncbi:MAG: hypothetical protein ACJ0RG_08110 [Candidatus Azotimanducaceae bacterium]
MTSTAKKFLVENFANIAIALSVIFLIFELNQNRRMMERELIFMEAQAFQSRTELAIESISYYSDPEILELDQKARENGIDSMGNEELTRLMFALTLRKSVIENTHYQVEIGLVDQAFWEGVGVPSVQSVGALLLAMDISMRPSFEAEVRRILAL